MLLEINLLLTCIELRHVHHIVFDTRIIIVLVKVVG